MSVSIALDDSVEQGAPVSDHLLSVATERWLSYSPACCLVLVACLSDIDTSYRLGAGLCLLFLVE